MSESQAELRSGVRVVVTGAHRRVPGALIRMLVRDPGVSRVYGLSPGPQPPALLGLEPARFRYESLDLASPSQLSGFFRSTREQGGVDTVVHLAFQGNPIGYSQASHARNLNSARNLLQLALGSGVEKYVFLSSDAVYRLGPGVQGPVPEEAELELDPAAHPIVRDTIDAEFFCRAKMDHERCEVLVLRPAGVIGGGVMSGINLLLESDPPLLPIGYDPLMNPSTRDQLIEDLRLSIRLTGKGVYNVAGPEVWPLSKLLAQHQVQARRIPGRLLEGAYRALRVARRSRYDASFHPRRLYFNLVLDDRRFARAFRNHASQLDPIA